MNKVDFILRRKVKALRPLPSHDIMWNIGIIWNIDIIWNLDIIWNMGTIWNIMDSIRNKSRFPGLILCGIRAVWNKALKV